MASGWSGDTVQETVTTPGSTTQNDYQVAYASAGDLGGPPTLEIQNSYVGLNIYSKLAVEIVIVETLYAYTFTDLTKNPNIVGASFDPSSSGIPSGTTLSFSSDSVTIDFHGYQDEPQINPVSAVVDLTFGTACYLAGTQIGTPTGEVPIETLAIGDRVITLGGAGRAIKWIGRRRYARRFVLGNPAVWPVLFRAGSLADGAPVRDLYVSPEHAMFVDGVLVPARHLVNGVSIVRADPPETIDYLHIELDSHDVIFANGAAAETFADDDSRAMFQNAAEFAARYPAQDGRRAAYCAPRVTGGFVLEAIRRRLKVCAEAG